VEGTSKLGVELTSLTLVDGQQLPIQSQMISRNGNTFTGRDAGAVAGTTALGAAIGASADWGRELPSGQAPARRPDHRSASDPWTSHGDLS